ncbi:MAG: PorV/PorQ family protein [Candidatus Cloacimonetes bacterium]|nr:PorV/PorQ family protein [Candidatus Cloacimonadota bacterium]MBS3767672.1 PorV/PorQ family protein [Candidatus Cloacimonadota bacterium]
MKKIILILLPLLLIGFSISYASDAGSKGFQIFKVDVDAALAGNGGSGIAGSGNAAIMWNNPAAVNLSNNSSFFFSHLNYIFDLSLNNATISFNKGKYSFGFGLTFLNYGSITKTDQSGDVIGEYHPTDLVGVLNYSRRITPSLYVGSNLKLAFEKIDTETAYSVATDLGLVYDSFVRNLNMAMAVQNLGTSSDMKDKSIELPSLFKIGSNYEFIINDYTAASISADMLHYFDVDTKINTGMTIKFDNTIYTRFGYKFNYDAQDLTMGLGIKIDRYDFNYSFVPYQNELGNSHIISLSHRF